MDVFALGARRLCVLLERSFRAFVCFALVRLMRSLQARFRQPSRSGCSEDVMFRDDRQKDSARRVQMLIYFRGSLGQASF